MQPKVAMTGAGKMVVILAIFFFVECVAGSCLSYGHACWGAHGKRGGHVEYSDESPNKDETRANLFLSKLVSPIDLLYYRGAWNADKQFKSDDASEELSRDLDKDPAKSDRAEVEAFFGGAARGGRQTIEDILKNDKFLEKQDGGRRV
ncbi:neuropeptide CCHamide-1 isoform X2 [Cylas formicarius]|uniref:neuropeptide CCHamide-1 isoform X2 n=1 Tax=Cylas formicarius TaxID=197179 RepID=UPI002958A092|nr:neuropeptide CCHamide-1 isoform X2 [Cylas formicarius]